MMLEIALDSEEEWDSSCLSEQFVRSAAEAAIAESAYPQLAASKRRIEISITLTGDEHVRTLNSKWRGKDRPTNVLSFPMASEADLLEATVAGPELLLGDVVLAGGVCAAEAAEKGLGMKDHAAHLLVHGTLHLLGYDHMGDEEAADMEAREIRALERLGVRNPYEVAA
jgi:probable rRNA maturation factor